MSGARIWAEHHDHGEVSTWSAPDVPPDAFTTTVVATLESLAAVFEPLSVEARFSCTSAADGWIEPTQHGLSESVVLSTMRRAIVPRRMYVGERVDDVPRVTPEMLGTWLSLFEGRCPADPGHVRRWTELWIESCAVRVSRSSLDFAGRLAVRAAERPGEVHEVDPEWIDGAPWVAAPTAALRRALVAPPISARFTNAYGVLRLTIDARWSLYTEATRERDALHAALSGLSRHGLVRDDAGATRA